jgi:hypothetical protein
MPKARKDLKRKARKSTGHRIFKYVAEDGIEYSMTFQQKKFCEAYLSFKANGVDAIFKAGYTPKNRLIASSMASDLLRQPNIFNYINSKFEEFGLNDDNVYKQHLFILNQNENLRVKQGAIDMMYKIRDKYAGEKIRVVNQFDNMTDEELDQTIEELEAKVARYKKSKKNETGK